MIKLKKIYQDTIHKIDTITNAIILKGFSPYIGENGNWFEYNKEQKEFVDTGIKAAGKDGINGTNGRDGTNRNQWKRWQRRKNTS